MQLSLDDYQKHSLRTAQYPKTPLSILYPAIGVSGEAGEILEKVKKLWRAGLTDSEITEDQKMAILGEVGDCLWYLAQICTELEFDLSFAAMNNLQKLLDRQQRNQINSIVGGDNR